MATQFEITAVMLAIFLQFAGAVMVLQTINPPRYFQWLSVGAFVAGFILLFIMYACKEPTPKQKETKKK